MNLPQIIGELVGTNILFAWKDAGGAKKVFPAFGLLLGRTVRRCRLFLLLW